MRDFLNERDAKDSGFDGSVLQQAITDCIVGIERIGDRLKPPEGIGDAPNHGESFKFAAKIQGYCILSKTSDDASESLKQLLDLSRKTEEIYTRRGLVIETMARESEYLETVLCLLPLLAASTSEVREVFQAVLLAEIREQEERTSRILDWIAPIEWFFQIPEFRHWVVSYDSRDLVCACGPGVGKSIPVSLIIDKPKAMHKDHDTAVPLFYGDYSEQHTRTPMYMATSLLRLLCTHYETIPPSVAKLYQETRNEVKDQMSEGRRTRNG
ncbi:hypothetical protein DV736_g1286, partial [Chaetothyriales sp. CBS 134916]